MQLVSLSAYFDGKTIQLEEPYQLEPNAKLIVTVLSESDPEGDSWLAWSRHQLDHAYNEEDDYPLDAIKAVNPEYAIHDTRGAEIVLPGYRIYGTYQGSHSVVGPSDPSSY